MLNIRNNRGGYCSEEIAVSFCLPVYNVASYIVPCINSIIDQQYGKIQFEIVCIDDCSTDDSYEILCNCAKTNSAIRVMKNESNRGVSYTRNRLIREAVGKYIWFVDPDDLLCKQSVAQIVEAAMLVDADIFLGNYMRFPDRKQETISLPVQEEFRYTQGYDLPKDQNETVMCAIWAGVIKRSFLLENQIRFHENMIAQEDTLFYWEMKIKCPKWYKCNWVCYLYRQRSTSVMHSHNDQRSRKYYEAMHEMLRTYTAQLENIPEQFQSELKGKILHSRENVALTLAAISDTKFAKRELNVLKKENIYPYPLRWGLWKSKLSLPRKILQFGMPFYWFFWAIHYIYKISNKLRA